MSVQITYCIEKWKESRKDLVLWRYGSPVYSHTRCALHHWEGSIYVIVLLRFVQNTTCTTVCDNLSLRRQSQPGSLGPEEERLPLHSLGICLTSWHSWLCWPICGLYFLRCYWTVNDLPGPLPGRLFCCIVCLLLGWSYLLSWFLAATKMLTLCPILQPAGALYSWFQPNARKYLQITIFNTY